MLKNIDILELKKMRTRSLWFLCAFYYCERESHHSCYAKLNWNSSSWFETPDKIGLRLIKWAEFYRIVWSMSRWLILHYSGLVNPLTLKGVYVTILVPFTLLSLGMFRPIKSSVVYIYIRSTILFYLVLT